MGHADDISLGGRQALLLAIVALHGAAILALAAIFAPQAVRGTFSAPSLSVIDLDIPEPPPPPPPQEMRRQAAPDTGRAGNPGRKATPREVTAPEPTIRIDRDQVAPSVASTGTANSAGASNTGIGTGAGGVGDGLGSGAGGEGTGGGSMTPTQPVKVSGDINAAEDYPTPAGGRQVRRGKSVTILLSVSAEGRPTSCRVVSASPDAEADAITCDLAMDRFRFEPARDSRGQAVPGRFGWRQRWF